MSIALHVNFVFHVRPFLFYSMLVHVMLSRIGYEDISAKQRRSLRVGVVLDIPRSLFKKIESAMLEGCTNSRLPAWHDVKKCLADALSSDVHV